MAASPTSTGTPSYSPSVSPNDLISAENLIALGAMGLLVAAGVVGSALWTRRRRRGGGPAGRSHPLAQRTALVLTRNQLLDARRGTGAGSGGLSLEQRRQQALHARRSSVAVAVRPPTALTAGLSKNEFKPVATAHTGAVPVHGSAALLSTYRGGADKATLLNKARRGRTVKQLVITQRQVVLGAQ